MTNPWDRRADETDKAWIAFVAYRDQGPTRLIKTTATLLARPAGYTRMLDDWATKYDWKARSAAWDGFLDRKTVQPVVARERAEMAERQAGLGRAMQGIAVAGLKGLKARAEKLKGSEVASLAKAGVDIERVAAGEPTEIQRVALVDEGRDRLRRIFGDDEVKA